MFGFGRAKHTDDNGEKVKITLSYSKTLQHRLEELQKTWSKEGIFPLRINSGGL